MMGEGTRYEGLPYEGPTLDFKDRDPEEALPTLCYRAHVDQFSLDDPNDVKAYERANERMNRGEGVLSYELKEYDAEIKSWRILVVWTELYYGPPENLMRPKVERPPAGDDGEVKTTMESKNAEQE